MYDKSKPNPTSNNSEQKPLPIKQPTKEYTNDSTSDINRPAKPKPPED